MSSITTEFAVKDHFEGKAPVVREIYAALLRATRQFGPVLEEPKKTSIHLVNTTAFAGVATRKDSLLLTIKSDRKLKSPRLHKTEQVSARRFYHQVKLTAPEQADAELLGWLKDAYTLSA
jgi:hypothetical protein